MKNKKLKLLGCLFLALVLCLAFTATAFAAEDPPITAGKTVTDNGNGTYTISLSILGDTTTSTSVKPTNVIFIVDVSGSMDTSTGTSQITYTTPADGNGARYGTLSTDPNVNSDADFFQLTERDDGVYTYNTPGVYAYVPTTDPISRWSWNPPTQYGEDPNSSTGYTALTYDYGGTYWNPTNTWYLNGSEYTGTRYHRYANSTVYDGKVYSRSAQGLNRLDAAKAAVNSVAEKLLENNTDANPKAFEVALVSFATNATIAQGPTSDIYEFEEKVNALSVATGNNAGTNWEASMRLALNIDFDDEDQLFVIFVSDGNPTFYLNDNNQIAGTGYESAGNIQDSYEQAVPAAEALVKASDKMYSIGAYGDVDRMESLKDDAGVDEYYSAANTDQLNAALDLILAEILEAGISDVSFDDEISVKSGTTKIMDLVEVIPDSDKYYRKGGANNYDSNPSSDLGAEWTDIPAACKAKEQNGSMVWDLSAASENGLLENGVTYTLTFDCVASQAARDLIAELKNGTKTLEQGKPNSVEPEVAPLIEKSGNEYAISTNGDCTVTYTDTRDPNAEPQTYDDIPNPGPKLVKAEGIEIEKTWVGTYNGEESAETINIGIKQDGVLADSFSLDYDSATHKHTNTRFISTGVMTVDNEGNVNTIGEGGHDFELTEQLVAQEEGSTAEEISYHWELKGNILHPMLINNNVVMLKEVKKSEVPDGVSPTKTVDGYYQIGDKYYQTTDDTKLTATNVRRSNLDLKKVVDGTAAPEDATFPFSVTITLPDNVKDDEKEQDIYYSLFVSDYSGYEEGKYVVQYEKDEPIGALVEFTTDGNKEMKVPDGAPEGTEAQWTGYYHKSIGSTGSGAITVTIPAGMNLRFLNLVTGTDYEITETIPAGYKCEDADIAVTVDPSTSERGTITKAAPTVSGSIISAETNYQVSFTNHCLLGGIEITKAITLPEGVTLPSVLSKISFAVSGPEQYSKNVPLSDFILVPAADGQSTTTGSQTYNYTYSITGLTKAGDYSIVETDSGLISGYTPTEGTSQTKTAAVALNGQAVTAAFTNTYQANTGSITIVKELAQDSAQVTIPPNTTFTVKDSKGKEYASKKYSEFTDNEGTKSITIPDIPAGTYTVEESGADVAGYDLTATGVTTTAAVDTPPVAKAAVRAATTANATVSDVPVSSTAATTVTFTNTYKLKPGTLDVVKTADPASGVKAGDEITFFITVTNNNEYEVTDIVVTDELTGDEIQVGTLAAGASKPVETKKYTVTEEDEANGKVHNVAIATGKDPEGGDVPGEGEVDVPTVKGSDVRYVRLRYVSNGGTEYPDQDFPYNPPDYPAITYQIDKEPIRPGYTFAGWYADSALTEPVSEVVMDRNRTVYAKWEKTETPGWLNDDDHYAYMIGYPDGLIQPNWNITRAEVATIFFRLLREEVREEYLTSTNSFSDVVEGQWFNTAISTVADMGIVNGYPDGTFKPNANITRAEFATIAARFDQLTKGTGNHFTDLDGHWAKEYIERAAKKGWVTGYPDGTFRPENLATRAEVATLVNRVLNRDPESPEDLLEGMVEWPDNMDTEAWYYMALQEASNTHDYERETKPTEVWTVLLENPDWTIYNH